jgi:hypothetical protein
LKSLVTEIEEHPVMNPIDIKTTKRYLIINIPEFYF